MNPRRLLASLALVALLASQAQAQSWTRIARWPIADGYPSGLALDASGNVYVAVYNWGEASIRKYTPDGTQVATFGSYGTGPGQFNPLPPLWMYWEDAEPWGIAVDPQGDLWAADRSNNRVQKITPAGEVTILPFTRAMAVATDAEGNAYALGNGVLRKYAGDGTLLTSWACSGVALAVGPDGFVYAAGGGQIWKYTSSGAFVSQIAAGFSNLTGIAVDAALGHLFATDCWYFSIQPSSSVYRIWELTTDGGLVTHWGDPSTNGGPVGVAVGPGGALYVTNRWNGYSVDVYARAATPAKGTSWGGLKSLYR